MELKTIKSEKDMVKIEVVGEDHTFCNVLRKELWQDNGTEVAGYSIKHSLVDNPILVVESSDAKKSLNDAVDRLKKINKEFLGKFKAI
jgi:DNA-directed RNA polymerase subunit L